MMVMVQQQQEDSRRRRHSDDEAADWTTVMINVIDDLSVAVMTSLAREQALQRQLDDVTSWQTRQSRDSMTSHVEWLRGWLEEERQTRRDMMTSQELLQKTLVECLRSANEQLSAVKVGLGPAHHHHHQMMMMMMSL